MSQTTAEAHTTLPIVAVAIGDPADIGPEISLKAALDSHVRALCRPVLVGDPELIVRHASTCGINASIRVVDRVGAVEADSNVPCAPCFYS
jgi:4-hydroxy-L-threonine phosphate dehydrogenase PdxA